MKDKEILSHILNLADSLQSHEEIELMQVKSLHGRIDNLQNILAAVIKLMGMESVTGKAEGLKTLGMLLADAEIKAGFSKLIAKMESDHEVKVHKLVEMRALLDRLPG